MLLKIFVFLLALFVFVRVFRRLILTALLYFIGRAVQKQIQKNNTLQPKTKASKDKYNRGDEGEYVDFEEVK
jgi:hypothetical protein